MDKYSEEKVLGTSGKLYSISLAIVFFLEYEVKHIFFEGIICSSIYLSRQCLQS